MSERADRNDLVLLAQAYLPIKRCPGGRLVHDQYVCVHCKHDWSDGKCDNPRRARKPKEGPAP